MTPTIGRSLSHLLGKAADQAATRKGLPNDLAARLERLDRNRRTTALGNGETVPPDDEDAPPF